MIETSVTKELKKPQRLQFVLIWYLHCVLLIQKSVVSINFVQSYNCQVVSKSLFLVGYPLGENLLKVSIGSADEKLMGNVLLFPMLALNRYLLVLIHLIPLVYFYIS